MTISVKSPLFSRYTTGGAYVFTDESHGTGELFFVDSNTGTNSTSRGKNPDTALATIDYAIGLCTANKGDKIIVMPGHAETLATAGAITADVAGISIIGLGNGSNRPTLTLSATDSTIAISAANVKLKNLRLTCSIDEVVSALNITGAGCTLDAVDYFETSSCQLIQFVLTTSAADQLTIQNCNHRQVTASAATQVWIKLVGVDDARILDNRFVLTLKDNAASCIIGATTAVNHCEIAGNTLHQTGYSAALVSVILMASGSTGWIHHNVVYSDQAAIAGAVAAASCACAENYCLNTVNKSGILDPVADS